MPHARDGSVRARPRLRSRRALKWQAHIHTRVASAHACAIDRRARLCAQLHKCERAPNHLSRAALSLAGAHKRAATMMQQAGRILAQCALRCTPSLRASFLSSKLARRDRDLLLTRGASLPYKRQGRRARLLQQQRLTAAAVRRRRAKPAALAAGGAVCRRREERRMRMKVIATRPAARRSFTSRPCRARS